MDNFNLLPVRVRYAKRGAARFISHLDLQRTFTKAITRAVLQLRGTAALETVYPVPHYTQGFNPRMKLVMALPLSLGTRSEYEVMDFWIRVDTCDDIGAIDVRAIHESPLPSSPQQSPLYNSDYYQRIHDALRAQLPPELEPLEAYAPETGFERIRSARYSIEVTSPTPDLQLLATTAFAGPVIVDKRTKRGEGQADIAQDILSIAVTATPSGIQLDATLAASPDRILNAEYIVKYLQSLDGVQIDSYAITRMELLDVNGCGFR